MIQYGFQRLALLNSADYARAELPLDASVSLIAPNNTGKTSLINALQFLLIIDKRRMDFGAHDVETSRKFYFPHNSAYILLEMTLPASGTVVVGCVGRGVSHDYEYFAYQGGLDLDDFRLPDGKQVSQPQLKVHLGRLGKLVFSYTSAEFSEGLYGRRRRAMDQEPDFTVFKLEHASQAEAFQRVLTRTLRLDKLRSGEVKDYLLAIFRRDLPDHNIDFKAEWDRAFAEVNADREQYLAAERQLALIQSMERQQAKRLDLRGKLLYFRPLVDERLGQWEAHFKDQSHQLREAIQEVEKRQSRQHYEDRSLGEQKGEASRQLSALLETRKRQAALANEFALVVSRTMLEENLAAERLALERQTTLVQNASSRGADAIRRDMQAIGRERDQLQRELQTLTDNLYLHLKALLQPEQLDLLNRALSAQTMTLGTSEFRIDPEVLTRWLEAKADGLGLPGLTLDTRRLAPQHAQRSPEDISLRLEELAQQAETLERQMAVARDLDTARKEKDRLDRSVRQQESHLQHYDEWQGLILSQAERDAQIAGWEALIAKLEAKLDQSVQASQRLRIRERELQIEFDSLQANHRHIAQLRENRRDDAPLFAALAELPHQGWIGSEAVALERLAETLAAYSRDCEDLQRLDRELDTKLAQIHAGGLTKFQFTSGSETEIQRIVEFANHLAQEDQALERKARSAVVNVTACLRELRDGLVTFKSRMRDFNRLINRRQLSDLEVFKIEPVDEADLVEAVEQLISTAEHAESGETFDLFNHASVLDDASLNRAKSRLIHEGEARGCLRVEHFFRLEFIVGKAGRKEESFTDIDSAASNGTVLMAKLVTGLALLHLMQDKRHAVQAVCYLDEASALDQRNQRNLIETAQEFGFALIFASPTPLVTARYCVPIVSREGHNHISRKHWQILEALEEPATP